MLHVGRLTENNKAGTATPQAGLRSSYTLVRFCCTKLRYVLLPPQQPLPLVSPERQCEHVVGQQAGIQHSGVAHSLTQRTICSLQHVDQHRHRWMM